MTKRKSKECERCKKLEALVEAQSDLICWYEDEMERSQYDDEDLPEEVLEAEHAIDKARSELDSFGERLIKAMEDGIEAIREDKVKKTKKEIKKGKKK